jgi:hypothetical protein
LIDALQIAAQNNRQYQSSKENVFRAALSLDLERDRYRNTFTGAFDSNVSTDLAGASRRPESPIRDWAASPAGFSTESH